jgi:hypothetical protein
MAATPQANARRRRRAPGLTLLTVGLVMLLAGCMNLTANVNVGADNTITGSIDMAVSKELAAVAGITTPEQLKQQMTEGGEVPAGMTVTTSADDKSLIMTLTGDLSQTEGLFTATSKGNVQTFTVTNNQDANNQDASAFPTADYKLTVTANFTGTVTNATEEYATLVDANTVRFSGPVMSPWKATATVDLGKPVADSPAAANNGSSDSSAQKSGPARGSPSGPWHWSSSVPSLPWQSDGAGVALPTATIPRPNRYPAPGRPHRPARPKPNSSNHPTTRIPRLRRRNPENRPCSPAPARTHRLRAAPPAGRS